MKKNYRSKLVRFSAIIFAALLVFSTSWGGTSRAADSLPSFNHSELYRAEEITDIYLLRQRAEANVDDLYARSGLKFDTMIRSTEETASATCDTLYTTQLLSVYEENGTQWEDYAITTMSGPFSVTNNGTKYNYTLISTIFYTSDSSYTYAYFQNSTAYFSVSGTAGATVSSLHMENWVDIDLEHESLYNSRTISSPQRNTTYSLSSPYSGGLYSYFAGIYGKATLKFTNGTEFEVLTYKTSSFP